MMPFIQSKAGRSLRRHFKKYGKSAGKLAPVLAGTLLVWITTALWHEFSWRYVLWGMYYCVIISGSLVLEGRFTRLKQRLHITESSKIYTAFCMMRTWMLLLVANVILQVKSYGDFFMVVLAVSIGKEKNVNILAFIDHQVLPVRWLIYYILLFGILLFGMYGSQYDAGQFLYMQF